MYSPYIVLATSVGGVSPCFQITPFTQCRFKHYYIYIYISSNYHLFMWAKLTCIKFIASSLSCTHTTTLPAALFVRSKIWEIEEEGDGREIMC